MSKIFFTADHHFFHANIIKYCNRPYGSVEQMNRDYIAKWNSVVGESDAVYHLGDLAWGKGGEEGRARALIQALKGKIVLIKGNHDKKRYYNKVDFFKLSFLDDSNCGWGTTASSPFVEVDNQKYYLKHKAEEEDYTKKRNVLCGHVHQKWQRIDNIINVGVDVWNGYPKTLDELLTQSKQAGRFYDCSKCKERLEIIKDSNHYKECSSKEQRS